EQVRLRQTHRRRVVDHEQEVDVAVDRLLEVLHVRRFRHERRLLAASRLTGPEGGSHRGQGGPAKHAINETTGHGILLEQGRDIVEAGAGGPEWRGRVAPVEGTCHMYE